MPFAAMSVGWTTEKRTLRGQAKIDANDPCRTLGLISGPVIEASSSPYQSTHLSRYDAIS